MERRGFIKKIGLGSTFVGLSGAMTLPAFAESKAAPTFNMDFAPHFGMFKNSAPGGIVDELKFMADQGFRSLEDNGMLKRSQAEQELIGKTLNDLGMRMGVFVVEGGDNWKVSLTTGKQEFLDTFLKTCRESVEVAKRVNAKWMTVVPGLRRWKKPGVKLPISKSAITPEEKNQVQAKFTTEMFLNTSIPKVSKG